MNNLRLTITIICYQIVVSSSIFHQLQHNNCDLPQLKKKKKSLNCP
uniref:Uncharacterized protein n=1 Tax=Rhizophora mucronata TaxID=61149 RepID=A0A2P2JIY6_RHIMU